MPCTMVGKLLLGTIFLSLSQETKYEIWVTYYILCRTVTISTAHVQEWEFDE